MNTDKEIRKPLPVLSVVLLDNKNPDKAFPYRGGEETHLIIYHISRVRERPPTTSGSGTKKG
jgi:hypothetical protein